MNLNLTEYWNTSGQTLKIQPESCDTKTTVDSAAIQDAACPETIHACDQKRLILDVYDEDGNFLNYISFCINQANMCVCNSYLETRQGGTPMEFDVSDLSDGQDVTAEFLQQPESEGGLIIIGTLNGSGEPGQSGSN